MNFSFYLGIALIVLSVLLQSLKAMNVIHLKRFFTVLILLTATQWAAAQEKTEEMPHVKSFVAEVSEQVEQGVPFTVTYTLSARSWQAGGKPLSGKGFRLLNVSYNTLREQPYMRMVATATYVTSLNGQVELPGMTIPVKGETVRTERKVINVTPNRRYGEEMRVAHEWLLNHGQHPDSICLSGVQEDGDFLLFEDIYNRCFCMVAQKSVWPLVGQPVLAYSTEDAIYMKNDRQHYNKMVQPYRSQISALKKSQGRSVVDEPLSYSPRSASVGPLLGDVRWGQNQPYNIGSPTIEGKKALTGCVPLAVGMILNYHQWPKKGTSHAYYQSTDQKVYEIDYADFAPQWSQFKKSYPEQGYDASIYSLSQVFTILGLSIDAKFKGNATSASLGNIKPTLCNNLGYSGRAMLHHKNLTDGQIASLIYRDLDRGLPCIVSSDGHAFVCDGYKDGFLHFNLGWYGNYNGYYRLKLGNYVQPEDGSNLLLVKYLMCNIEPQREERHRDVVVEQAGTLSKLLSQDEKEQLTSLRLSGELNSSDIRLLRKMTGGSDDLTEYGSWQGGALTRLDMKDATIVADEEPYLTIVATGGWTHSVTENDVTTTVSYDFGHMDEQQWQQFKTDIGEKQEGVIYSRSDDNRYWANYHCENDVVGNQMFLRCASLREIILPQSTKKIDSFAFFGCSLLQRIKVPEQTAQLGRKPFSNCSSLELIELPRNIQTEDEVSESCSPALNQKVY